MQDTPKDTGKGRDRKDGYPHGESESGEHIAEYLYLDEHNAPYLRVVKTENKTFPQYHWVEGDKLKTRGHWELGAPKGPKIPYNLP